MTVKCNIQNRRIYLKLKGFQVGPIDYDQFFEILSFHQIYDSVKFNFLGL